MSVLSAFFVCRRRSWIAHEIPAAQFALCSALPPWSSTRVRVFDLQKNVSELSFMARSRAPPSRFTLSSREFRLAIALQTLTAVATPLLGGQGLPKQNTYKTEPFPCGLVH